MRAALVSLAAIVAALVFMAPAAGAAATFNVTSSADGGDVTPIGNVCDADPGAAVTCTLRAAIEQANAAPGVGPDTAPYTISFSLPLNDREIAVVASDLPPIEVDGTTINGCATIAPSPAGPCVGLRANANRQGTGLDVEGDGVTLRGLAISRFATGVAISGTDVTLHNSDLGVRLNPTTVEGMGRGAVVTGSSANIGGPGAAQGNAFAGNDDGLLLFGADLTAVQGNLVGLLRSGVIRGNGRGIAVTGAGIPGVFVDDATDNVIGGESNAAIEDGGCGGNCNIIAGSTVAGIDLDGDVADGEAPAASVTVAGNWIGLDGEGDAASNNVGIAVGGGGRLAGDDASGALIGGPDPEDGNLISGNAIGVDQLGGQGVLTLLLNVFGVGYDHETQVPNTTTNARLGGGYQQKDAIAVGNNFGASAAGLILTGPQPCISSNFFTPFNGTYTQAAVIVESGATDARIGNEVGCVAGNFTPGNYFGKTAPTKPAILIRGADKFVIVSNRVGMIPFAAPLDGPGVRIVDAPPGGDPSVIDASVGGRIGGDNPNLWNAFTRLSGPAVEIDGHATGIVIAGGEGIAVNDAASASSLWTDLLSIPALGNAPTGQNGGIQPPTIGASTTSGIAGTGEPGATIRVLQRWRADNPTDGIDEPASEGYTLPTMGATTTVAPDGTWSIVFSEKLPEGQGITASQTTAAGSSEFAALKTATPAPALPVVQITGGPIGTTSERNATFTFSTPTPGATLECSLDGGAFAPCASPATFGPLEPGAHQFRVQARVISTVSLPVSRTWAIEPPAPAPAGPSSPSGGTASSSQRFTALVSLPSTRRCVSRRKLRLRLRKPTGAKIVFAEIRVTGRPLRTVSGRALTAAIDLRGLPKGRVRVRVRVVLSSGRVVSGTRTYRTCAPKKPKKR